jgi:hypothetical protein
MFSFFILTLIILFSEIFTPEKNSNKCFVGKKRNPKHESFHHGNELGFPPFKFFLVLKVLHISIPKFARFHFLFEEIIF